MKESGIYRVFYEDFMQKLGFATDVNILVYTVLHEIGHWKHFCEVGKRPFELILLGEDFCELRASEFADKYFSTCLNEITDFQLY